MFGTVCFGLTVRVSQKVCNDKKNERARNTFCKRVAVSHLLELTPCVAENGREWSEKVYDYDTKLQAIL